MRIGGSLGITSSSFTFLTTAILDRRRRVRGIPESVPAEAVAQWFQAKGIKHVGIVVDNTNYTLAEATADAPLLKKEGITVTQVEYPPTTLDLTPELQQLKSAGVQGIYSAGLPPLPGVALKARAGIGWDVPIVFDNAGASADITKLAPVSDDNNAFEQILAVEDPFVAMPGRAAMLQYAKPYGDPTTESLEDAGIIWDTVIAYADAAKAAGGSVDVLTLDKAMLQLPSNISDLLAISRY